jgi:hypothetical protein
MLENSILFTVNIKFAAFLRMKHHHPDVVNKLARGKASYGYSSSKIPESVWADLKSEFDKSEFITYAHCLDAIRDLAY